MWFSYIEGEGCILSNCLNLLGIRDGMSNPLEQPQPLPFEEASPTQVFMEDVGGCFGQRTIVKSASSFRPSFVVYLDCVQAQVI
jgi:hypothetical protein